MNLKIYLDNNATTLIDPRVAAVMIENLNSPPENPSSIHFFGREAKNKLLKAREILANYLKAKPHEILFTSGGTESMNLLLKGLISPSSKPHILTSNIEHACVENTLLDLQSKGCEVTFLKAGLKGFVDVEEIEKAITPATQFLVFGAVNSETGVKIDLESLSRLAFQKQIPLLVDGVALLGKEPILLYPGITGIGFSAHKCHGPKGVGFVFFRSKTFAPPLSPLLIGGGQEYGFRSGTENMMGILGLAKAIELLQEELDASRKKMLLLRDRFEQALTTPMPFIQINGTGERTCNVSNLCFPGVDAETLLIQLDLYKIAASQGSACSSGALEPSRVLIQMGLSPSLAKSSIRFSLSKFNTEEEIDTTVHLLKMLIPKLKS